MIKESLLKTFSYKNALTASLLCLFSIQASASSSEPKKPSKPKSFTFKRGSESATRTVSETLYRARTLVAPDHVALVQKELKSVNTLSGFSKESKIEYYTDEGKRSFRLADGQALCAQEQRSELGCGVQIIQFPLNSKNIIAVHCYCHQTYHKLEAIAPKDAIQTDE